MSTWRPEVTLWVVFVPLCFVIGSVTEPGVHYFGQIDWTAGSGNLLVSAPALGYRAHYHVLPAFFAGGGEGQHNTSRAGSPFSPQPTWNSQVRPGWLQFCKRSVRVLGLRTCITMPSFMSAFYVGPGNSNSGPYVYNRHFTY